MNRIVPRSYFKPGAFALAIAALIPSLPAFAAAGDKLGPEFRVNTFTSGNQGAPAVAHSANGDFVVAWADYSSTNAGIFYRRYRANGTAKDASAVRVASPPDDPEFEGIQSVASPDVAMDDDGDFVVAWQAIQDGGGAFYLSNYDLVRRYSADGTPKDTVNLGCFSTNEGPPSVAMDSAGDFVVTASTYDIDANYPTIFPRATFFDANGHTTQGCVQVGTRYGFDPVAAMDSNGNFVVGFQSIDYDDFSTALVVRRFHAGGTLRDPDDIVVATNPPFTTKIGGIAVDDRGDFILAWEQPNTYPSATSSNIMMRRYRGDMSPKAPAEQVSTGTTGFSRQPSLGLADDGSFALAWEQLNPAQTDADVLRRRFNASGAPVSGNVRVNTRTTGFQDDPAIAVNADGSFVVAWESANQDGSGDGVYAQRHEGLPSSVPTVRFSQASSSVKETAGTVNLSVILSTVSTREVIVPVAASGTATLGKDYKLPMTRVVIGPGLTSANFQVGVINDTKKEGNETVILTLGTPRNAKPGTTPSHKLTILAND